VHHGWAETRRSPYRLLLACKGGARILLTRCGYRGPIGSRSAHGAALGASHLICSAIPVPEIARILGRRTNRRYTAQPVDPPLIDLLIAAAFSASSKSDFQQASIIRVNDPDKRRAIGVAAGMAAHLLEYAIESVLENRGRQLVHPRQRRHGAGPCHCERCRQTARIASLGARDHHVV
jgi:hypothetical protein